MRDSGLVDHPFVAGFEEEHLDILASCVVGRSAWKPGQPVLLRGNPADMCHLLIDGTVVIEIRSPGSAPRAIQTIYGDELLGWSWLFEPYLWTFDARALEETTAFTFDAEALRNAINDNAEFGLALVMRVTKAIVNRLKATRLQVLDVYNR